MVLLLQLLTPVLQVMLSKLEAKPLFPVRATLKLVWNCSETMRLVSMVGMQVLHKAYKVLPKYNPTKDAEQEDDDEDGEHETNPLVSGDRSGKPRKGRNGKLLRPLTRRVSWAANLFRSCWD